MKLKRKNKIFLISLLVLGIIGQSMTMIRSGLIYDFGMGFWGANGHDGVWHLALINQVLKGFPPPHPNFAGFKLTNYHYFYDLILALINRFTGIPAQFLYFQIWPVLIAFGLGFLSFWLGWLWRKDFWTGFWLVFFNYFGGSFGWLVTLWRQKEIGGESLFWAMQSISSLINPPFAFSLLVLLAGMIFLLRVKKWSAGKIVGLSLLFGILVNIKAYAGAIGLSALAVFSLLKLAKRKRGYFLVWLGAVLISLLIFIPINRQAGSLFIFKPLWFIHSMIESPDRLYLPQLALARYFLIKTGVGPRLILIEALGLALFLIGNLGTRIIGLGDWLIRLKKKKLDDFDGFLISGALASLLPSLFLIQKGTAWNTIQFFYYFLFFANFYAAAVLARLTKKKTGLCLSLLSLILILTLPTSYGSLKHFWGWPPPAALSKPELEALSFLRKQKSAFVLTYPYDQFEKGKYSTTPIDLRAYESTGYVAAFSGQQTFLEDEVNLEISGYDWPKRRQELIKFFASQDPIWARGFLLNNQIGYLYLVGDQNLPLTEADLGIEKIFDNQEARIYQVRGIITMAGSENSGLLVRR
jgi:hypothetical protein